MYQATAQYNSAIVADNRKINVTLTAGAEVYEDGEELKSLLIESGSGSTDKIIGKAISAKMTAEISNPEAVPVASVVMSAKYWPDGVPESDAVLTTDFILESVDADEDEVYYTLVGYDAMSLLDAHTADEIEIEYPSTIGAYTAAAAATAGLNLADLSWPNANAALPAPPNLDGSETCRSIIAWAAECALGNAYIDRNGDIKIVTIVPSETRYDINPDLYFECTLGSAYGPINTLTLARLPQGDNIFRADAAAVEADGRIEVQIADNPFLEEIREDVIDEMFALINGVEVHPYTLDWCGNPAFEPGDTITLTDTNDSVCIAIYGAESLDFDGGMRSSVEFKSPSNTTVDYSKAASAREKLRRTSLQVDKVNGRIESMAEQTYTREQTDIKISSAITQEADRIKSEVSQTYVTGDQLTEVKSSVEQQSEQIEFRFTNVSGELQNVSDALADNQSLLEEYIRFRGALIELGKVGNKFTAELDNERLAFLENGVQIAYISNNKLYITDAEVSEHLAMGKADRGYYDLYVRSNGHITLKRRR